MNIIRVIFLIMLFPAVVFAQKTTADSVYTYHQAVRELNYVIESGTQLINSGTGKLSTAGMNYQTANGHFRTAQEAEHSKKLGFNTSGITTLDKFKLYGRFSFSRAWQDSLAWTMQGTPDPAEPYYFTAGKAGKYQRLNYNMGGLATYQLPGKHFYLATGIDYQYNTASRSVDPRPSVQTFNILLKPELIYRYGKQTVGIGTVWGYEHENNNVSYKNIDFNKGLSYPDRVNYLIMGYGYNTIRGAESLIRRSKFNGANINYAYADTLTSFRTRLAYQTQKENNFFPLENSENDLLFSSFYLHNYSFSFLASHRTATVRHQLYADMNYQKGNDRNLELGGVNYRYSGYNAHLDYSLQPVSSSSFTYEFGFNTLLYNQYQKDISAAHTIDFTYAEPGLYFTVYKKYTNTDRFRFSLSPGLRLPINHSFNVPPAQENVFTYNIAYPAYTYYSSTVGRIKLNMEYTTSYFLKGVKSGFAINSVLYKPLTTGTVYTGSTFIPSKNFMDLSFSFNIYF